MRQLETTPAPESSPRSTRARQPDSDPATDDDRSRSRGRSLAVSWGAVVIVSLLVACVTPLMAQETYYWAYSQHPAWSYFDHPPMVAWGIGAGTGVFGLNAFGVRCVTLIWAFGTTVFGQLILREFGASVRTQAMWVFLSLGVPILAASHFLANPDAPLTFFWTLCMYALWRARNAGSGWWFLAGIGAGGAMLSKYSAVFLGAGGVIVLLWDPVMRRRLKTSGPWLALVVATACFSPVIIWNAEHDWASFLFQTQRRYESTGLDFGTLGRFAGEQAALMSPFLFVLLPATMIWVWRGARRGDDSMKWLLAFGVPMVFYMGVNSLYMTVKMNWIMPCAVPVTIAVLLWVQRTGLETRRPRTARILRIGVFATLGAFLAIPALVFVPAGIGTSWSGWEEICQKTEHWVREARRQDRASGRVFVFAPDYRDASQLTYHLARSHVDGSEVPTVMAQNVYGEGALEYDFWTRPARFTGSSAVFVVIRPGDRKRDIDCASRRFERMTKVERVSVRRWGNVILQADIFIGIGYRGPG
jgi:Dolichyl-phosphate-mannose-protein mannosyltransferase